MEKLILILLIFEPRITGHFESNPCEAFYCTRHLTIFALPLTEVSFIQSVQVNRNNSIRERSLLSITWKHSNKLTSV